MAEPQTTSFDIRLLEGEFIFAAQSVTDDPTRIELIGRMLPHKGVSFPTKQRSKTTYYPGNPVGSQQLFGAIKDNTTISGVWDDSVLGPGFARTLVRQFEYVVEHGFPVEVRWGGTGDGGFGDVGIVRRGIIKSIDPKYDMAQIVAWTIEFEWKGEGLPTTAPTFAAGPSEVSTKSDEFAFLADQAVGTSAEVSSWQETVFSVMAAGAGALAAVNDALDEAQSAFAAGVTVLDWATDIIQTGAELPSSVADRVRGCCDRIVNCCMNIRASYDSVCGLWPLVEGLTGQDWIDAGKFFQLQAKTARLALVPNDDPLDQLSYASHVMDVIAASDQMAEQAARQAAALEAQMHPDVIAEERPPAGSDLRDLAMKHYGDADLWLLIADYNDLDSSEVPATPLGPSDFGAPPIYIPDPTAYAAMLAQLWGAPQQDNSSAQ